MIQENKTFSVPILMLVFNRPKLTKVVLDKILEQNPQKLYVVADGPREHKKDDEEKCKETRALFDNLPSEVQCIRLFRDKNLGSKLSVSSGITWFFEQEESGIILEDDCLPNHSFFPFMEQLLDKYRDDDKVMHIGGNNFQLGRARGFSKDASYYFSNLTHIWGWATWRSTWQKYNMEMKGLEEFYSSNKHKEIGWEWFYHWKYKKHFKSVAQNKMDAWDYQYHFTVWQNGGLSILPNVNLVENIGFGVDATHTFDNDSILSKVPTCEMKFPIIHPTEVKVDDAADNFTLGLMYGKNWLERIKKFIIHKIR